MLINDFKPVFFFYQNISVFILTYNIFFRFRGFFDRNKKLPLFCIFLFRLFKFRFFKLHNFIRNVDSIILFIKENFSRTFHFRLYKVNNIILYSLYRSLILRSLPFYIICKTRLNWSINKIKYLICIFIANFFFCRVYVNINISRWNFQIQYGKRVFPVCNKAFVCSIYWFLENRAFNSSWIYVYMITFFAWTCVIRCTYVTAYFKPCKVIRFQNLFEIWYYIWRINFFYCLQKIILSWCTKYCFTVLFQFKRAFRMCKCYWLHKFLNIWKFCIRIFKKFQTCGNIVK